MKKSKGFTLIELLIVVAIIAILAAIAIPNFLQAQVRAKVSRAKGELRTVTTGLESYYVDNNSYPITTETPEPDGIIPVSLSTPVSYITQARPYDPFKLPGYENNPAMMDQAIYTYHNLLWRGIYSPQYLEAYGQWRICSIGPDGDYWNKTTHGWPHVIEYDPTNGTVSQGNIWRSQKHTEPYEWRPI
jgi:prepilin-type N-terminal cleavage/methylation domain-containing protein